MKYGHKWASLTPDDATLDLARNVWANSLAGITDDQIKLGLDLCDRECIKWPPTPGEFLALCRSGKSDLPEFKGLPKPWGGENIANPAFDKLKKILHY